MTPKALSHAEAAKTLVASHGHGVLSTLSTDGGYPFGTVIEYHALSQGDIVVLLSRTAEHYRYLKTTSKASLLVNPLMAEHEAVVSPRVTLLGDAASIEPDARLREAYLLQHPQARAMLERDDLRFFQLDVTGVRYIAGAGRPACLDLPDYRAAEPDPLGPEAAWMMHNLSQRHEEDLVTIARNLGGLGWTQVAQIVAIDRYGFDLICFGEDQRKAKRFAFDAAVSDEATASRTIRKLLARARLLGEPL